MKKINIILCFILFVSVLAVQNCESPFSNKSPVDQGFFRLLIKDAPLDLSDVKKIYVTVSEVAVKKASSDNYIVVLDKETEFELLELKNNPQPIVETYLEVGHYTGIRFVVESARIIVGEDEEEYGLNIPSMEIIVNVEFDVTENDTIELTLDFDAEQSIQVVKAGKSGIYILRPVILVDDISYN